ncbi:hypothetical protein P1P75_37525 [Streptomyces sp. ID05-39B]|uniref:hypothetical protein n=1 Tax=Streptomyces sp. ID05-39B TaxID=3028664 RepID=UPI0029A7F808|nr:hypothetical protein [Streptomyces sp. ID05-39B]MDX3531950.1 hypothetical protein [Streptomyces sp. ID05-39B]
MTRTRPASSRGRGRPLLFTDDQKQAYLKHVTAGLTLNEAAAAINVDRRTVNHHAQQDPDFRTARETAKKAGREARWENLPHDEYRYNHAGCRCLDCKAAARKGRAARRVDTTPDASPQTGPEPGEAPTVISLPNRDMRPDQHLHPLAAVS